MKFNLNTFTKCPGSVAQLCRNVFPFVKSFFLGRISRTCSVTADISRRFDFLHVPAL